MTRRLGIREYISLSQEAHELAKQGRHEEALRGCQLLIDGAPTRDGRGSAHCTRGVILWTHMSGVEKAIEDFSRAIQLVPDDSNPLLWRAQCYEETGRKELALRDWLALSRRRLGEEALREAQEAVQRLKAEGVELKKWWRFWR